MPIMQSNSLRGKFMQDIVDTTVREILSDIQCMFGPGASDAFITKNDQIYYTRDGKEVMESLMFDNELANKVHHILYQAAYHQGKNVGDGSTTLMVLYCHLYFQMRKALESGKIKAPINVVRSRWTAITEALTEKIKSSTVKLTPDTMLSMFYTCTQDPELSAKIFSLLKDAIMAGAHIVPRKSNIATDFNVTTYNRPTVQVTRQFSIKPVKDITKDAVVLYCNGTLDLVHPEVLASMATQKMFRGDQPVDLTYIILCHGTSAATRSTLREFGRIIRNSQWDVNALNNIVVCTMDDALRMDKEELEDISTIITEEPGIDTVVNAITYEALLYNAFDVKTFNNDTPIEDLEHWDGDAHAVDQIRGMCVSPYEVIFDAVDGMAIGKDLGPVATERYKNLCQEAEVEKSGIRRASLESRIRKSYGMFIDIEVGSNLLKDSQRKFELILDAIVSGATAAQEDILIGNSILHALRQVQRLDGFNREIDKNLIEVIAGALAETMVDLISNCYDMEESLSCKDMLECVADDNYNIADFTLRDGPDQIWPRHDEAPIVEPVSATFTTPDGSEQILQIAPRVVEPFGSISAILANSTLPIEIAMTKVFHLSGKTGFMSNYISAEE